MIQTLSQYSTLARDERYLSKIAAHFGQLSVDQQAAIAIAALFEAVDPTGVYCDYDYLASPDFTGCLESMLLLSRSGKIALVRAIAEHLAVLEFMNPLPCLQPQGQQLVLKNREDDA